MIQRHQAIKSNTCILYEFSLITSRLVLKKLSLFILFIFLSILANVTKQGLESNSHTVEIFIYICMIYERDQ